MRASPTAGVEAGAPPRRGHGRCLPCRRPIAPPSWPPVARWVKAVSAGIQGPFEATPHQYIQQRRLDACMRAAAIHRTRRCRRWRSRPASPAIRTLDSLSGGHGPSRPAATGRRAPGALACERGTPAHSSQQRPRADGGCVAGGQRGRQVRRRASLADFCPPSAARHARAVRARRRLRPENSPEAMEGSR
jgi:hypothetical protein